MMPLLSKHTSRPRNRRTAAAAGLLALACGTGFGAFAVAPAAAATLATNSTMSSMAPDDRNPGAHNVPKKGMLAIEGYDPVAYFPEGGGKPTKGNEKFSLDHDGITYRFASQANLDRFRADPAKYEPAHGGWCSYAMGAKGEKVEVDPKSYVVSDGRLFLFYKSIFADTRSDWLKDKALEQKADTNWKKVSGESPHMGGRMKEAPTTTKLQDQLDQRRMQFEKSAPAATKTAYEQGIREVDALKLAESSVKVGQAAPDFSLPNADGKTVKLSDLLKDGPVVLTWYRGGWCPYCNMQLHAYQEILPDLKAAKASLVAISPETPDNSLSTKEKNALEFFVLSDSGNAVAKRYGIAYKLPQVVVDQFSGRLDLSKFNGDSSNELPLSATYVIGQDGRVTYRFVDSDYRNRAEPADVLAAVKNANSGKR